MTYGTSANAYLVGRRPSRLSPHRAEQNRPDRQRTVDPAHKKETYSASFASAAWKPATHRGKMLKLISLKF
jgi:hypothetical protein